MGQNTEELEKHIKYRCRLNIEEKYFGVNNEVTIQLNRKLTKYTCLSNESIMLDGNKVKYDAENQLWICTICNETKNKYNRKRIITHVNSTHGGK